MSINIKEERKYWFNPFIIDNNNNRLFYFISNSRSICPAIKNLRPNWSQAHRISFSCHSLPRDYSHWPILGIRILCTKYMRCLYCARCIRTFDMHSERPFWPHALQKRPWISWPSLCQVSIYSLWIPNHSISWPTPNMCPIFASATIHLCVDLFRLANPSNIYLCMQNRDRNRIICARFVVFSCQCRHPSICANWCCSQSAFDVLQNNRTENGTKRIHFIFIKS